MTDEEIVRAFEHTPRTAGLLLLMGYWFMLTHASFGEVAMFSLGIWLIVTGVWVAAHDATVGSVLKAVPLMVLGTITSFIGAFVVLWTMSPYL